MAGGHKKQGLTKNYRTEVNYGFFRRLSSRKTKGNFRPAHYKGIDFLFLRGPVGVFLGGIKGGNGGGMMGVGTKRDRTVIKIRKWTKIRTIDPSSDRFSGSAKS